MKRAMVGLAAVSAAIVGLGVEPAFAQAVRTFVSGHGSDSNACSLAAPCRSFQHAHDVTASGGEIDVLDPGGYGALTISKAISIQGHGFSGISVPSGNGITINATLNDAVHLNGLLMDGIGTGNIGVDFIVGKSLTLENCVIRNFFLYGLRVLTQVTFGYALTVSNSYFADNLGSGIFLEAVGSGAVTASIDRTVFSGNGATGLTVSGASGDGNGVAVATVTDSIAVLNRNGSAGTGFLVHSDLNKSAASMVLTRVTAADNFVGISASGANAGLVVSQSTITGNTTGFSAVSGGFAYSAGDNLIFTNANNSGSLNPVTKQ